MSELGKLPKGFKSATKSAANFRKDFTGSLKGLGSAITGPFQVLTPKLSATVGKIGKVVSGVPGKIGGAVGKIGSAIASKIPRITSAFSLLGDTAGYLGAWGGQIGSALQGVLGMVGRFIPSFVGLMNFGAVAAVVVAGLGLVYSCLLYTSNTISICQTRIQRSSSRIRSHSQMETVSREGTTRNSMVKENIPIPEGKRDEYFI